MYNNLIEATIVTGCDAGQTALIPRIPLIPSDTPLPFKRLQFPLRLSFSLSINKAQGQTMRKVGLFLDPPPFAHGQTYVAASRVGSADGLYICAPTNRTKNVVLKKALE